MQKLHADGECWGVQILHKHLLSSPLRTLNPQQAQLFFIPVYLGRHFNWFWQQWSTPGDPWEILKDCEPRFRAPSAECWYEKWAWAKGVSPHRWRVCHVLMKYSMHTCHAMRSHA